MLTTSGSAHDNEEDADTRHASNSHKTVAIVVFLLWANLIQADYDSEVGADTFLEYYYTV